MGIGDVVSGYEKSTNNLEDIHSSEEEMASAIFEINSTVNNIAQDGEEYLEVLENEEEKTEEIKKHLEKIKSEEL